MSDYISREAAKTIIDRLRDKCGNDEMSFALNWASRLIRDTPAADVVEVVRCCECAYHDDDSQYHYCRKWGRNCPNDSDFFCKWGKCMDGGQDDGTA